MRGDISHHRIMKHILHFIHGLNVGGAETFIVNIIKQLDSNTYCFDFAIQNAIITNPSLLDIIAKERITIYTIPSFPRHPFAQYRYLKMLIAQNSYDVVHIHMNAAINPIPLLVGKFLKNKHIKFLVHSHSAYNCTGGKLAYYIHKFNSKLLIDKSYLKVACSNVAGTWMFGKSGFQILNNAVDVKKFAYNEINRLRIRKELNIGDNHFVIGNVGRFVYAKNHEFMIDIFSKYVKFHPQTLLLLVGDGPLKNKIKQLAEESGIIDKIIFTGERTDIPQLLSAMDCFLFPSHFEGFGFVAVEAQANGLRVVASDQVPKDINCGNFVKFLSFYDSREKWIAAIESSIIQTRAYERLINPVSETKFDITRMISVINNIYNN